MSVNFSREPMLDMFIFETQQLMEQLEQSVLSSERISGFESSINEIFRIMHTIKSSAAMMLFNNISTLAHSIEDLFYYLREQKPKNIDNSKLTDIVLEGVDFIKNEIAKIELGKNVDGDASLLINDIKEYLSFLKGSTAEGISDAADIETEDGKAPISGSNAQKHQYYISSFRNVSIPKENRFEATVYFEDGCEMENIRAFTILHNLKEKANVFYYSPEDIIENEASSEFIKREGFRLAFTTFCSLDEMKKLLLQTVFLKELHIEPMEEEAEPCQAAIPAVPDPEPEGFKLKDVPVEIPIDKQEKEFKDFDEIPAKQEKDAEKKDITSVTKQNVISVNVTKLDRLMDLVGELVISESMVTKNPDLEGKNLESFNKEARQLKKITDDLQDIVMSIRMVSLSVTFQKMNRLVRDMSRRLNKEVQLDLIGEQTEVDKNIIEHISDPLMHLIRNSIDHGIEPPDERSTRGKPRTGTITLEAKNAGGDVWILVKDDGKGLNKEKIYTKAVKNGITNKAFSELSDREIFSFIFLPGFSTNDNVTEFSGRGVGMDVVTKNIEKVGGSVTVDSTEGAGTTISMKIPLTLAIIDGIIIKVGNLKYIVPTTSIKQSFKLKESELVTDPDGNEMVLVRGECYPIMRLHRLYNINTEVTAIKDGIIMMVESDLKSICLFADTLVGEQQVVVKALPKYIKKVSGIAGCTLLGDGSISLILDVAGLVNL